MPEPKRGASASAENARKWPNRDPPRFEYSAAGAIITIFAIVEVIWLFSNNPALAIAMTGAIVFFAVLTLADYSSPDVAEPGLSTGEMRAAISATIMVVYILIVGFFISSRAVITADVLNSFSNVTMVMVGFYFGTKGLAEILRVRKP